MKKSTMIAGAIAVALVIGLGLFGAYLYKLRSPAERSGLQTSAAISEYSAPENPAVDIPKSSPSATLPSSDLPFSATVDQLKRMDARGEAGATCRLAAEYAYCAQLPFRRAAFDRWLAEREQSLALLDSPEAKQSAASNLDREIPRRQAQVDELQAHCQGVAPLGSRELVQLWRRSALAGNPAAMKQYAAGNAFRWGEFLDALPELEMYKKEAERIATISAQRGDFDMMLMLAASYSPSQTQIRPLLAQAIKPDLARSLALYRQIETALVSGGYEEERISREVSAQIKSLEASAGQEDIQRANQITSGELQSWDRATIRGVDRLNTSGRLGEINRDWCER